VEMRKDVNCVRSANEPLMIDTAVVANAHCKSR
jgi:hypothetical protein